MTVGHIYFDHVLKSHGLQIASGCTTLQSAQTTNNIGSGYGHNRRVSSLGCYWHDGSFPYISHCGHDHRVSSTRLLRCM